MIRSIRIQQWRSYRDATIDLDHPVVFFVAENGVGKSSFFEAARCCLLGFPTGRNAGRAVRADADRAQLSMDLVLGDADVISVTRALTRTGRASFSALRNGETIDEQSFLATMQAAWAADRSLIDRLMFGESAAGRARAPLPIRDHLAELLGVTPMLEAATALRAAQADAAARIASVREAVKTTVEEIASQEAAVEAARLAVDEVAAERETLRARIAAAEEAAALAAAWERYRADATAYNERVEEVRAEIARVMSIDVASRADALEDERAAVEAELGSARNAVTHADLAAARAATAASLLADPVDTCPTCLRPLSEQERSTALSAHGEATVMSRSDNEHAVALVEQAEQRLRVITDYTRRLDRLQAPSEPDVADPGQDAVDALDEVRIRDGELAERLGEARVRLEAAEQVLARTRTQATEATKLDQAAREELLLDTMSAILENVADRYLSERIEPLTEDVAFRWKLVFGTEGLTLDPNGEIRLRRGSLDLDLDDMSGGERAIASVIVRLLVSAAATRIPTVWFDEPLEHLDPRRRAGVAASLVQAVATGTLPQIVITTYEEGIARRLALAAPELAAVVYAEPHTGLSDRESPL
ncbi:MAG: AAA family ATPase [Actinomycetota bacterium]|nr:AAA family ATPase [Actinomycetota bacterium]